ncbi:MAG: DUF4153 domain-containing protein [Clostridia bacterium]|nr:DUF4153 domain-containing protein [Clostridia bacterium]
MKIIDSLKKSSAGVIKTSKRFPMTFVCLAAVFIMMTLLIFSDFDSEDIGFFMIALICGAFFALCLELAAEKLSGRWNRTLLYVLSTLLPVVMVFVMFLLHYMIDEDYHFIYVFGVIGVSVIASLVMMIKDAEKLEIFPILIKSFLLAFAIGLILFAGTSLCVFAFDSLIFEFDDVEQVYMMLANISWFVGALLFLSHVFSDERDEHNRSIAYKIVFLYTELPIYLLLIAILYIYLLKIIASLDIPSGGINMFASLASAFYIFNCAALKCYDKENKFASFYIKAGGIIMIPVIIMQCVSLGIRLYYYGLTSARMLSVCFIIVTLIFVISSIIRKFNFKTALACSAVIVGIVMLTPFNIINIPVKSQERILEKTLASAGLFDENGEIIPASDIDSVSMQDKQKITGAFDYLRYTPAKLKDNLEIVKYADFNELFGFGRVYGTYEEPWYGNDVNYFWFGNTFAEKMLDISEYKSMVYVYYDYRSDVVDYYDDDLYYSRKDLAPEETEIVEKSPPEDINTNENYGIDFMKIADMLIENSEGTNYTDNLVIPVDDEKDFIFIHADMSKYISTGEYKSIYMSGYVLFK